MQYRGGHPSIDLITFLFTSNESIYARPDTTANYNKKPIIVEKSKRFSFSSKLISILQVDTL